MATFQRDDVTLAYDDIGSGDPPLGWAEREVPRKDRQDPQSAPARQTSTGRDACVARFHLYQTHM